MYTIAIETSYSFLYVYEVMCNRTRVVDTMLWLWQPTVVSATSQSASITQANLPAQMAFNLLVAKIKRGV